MSTNPNIAIRWPGGGTEVPALPETALDSLVKAGVPIPHSCKRGDCLQCVARMIEGAGGQLASSIVKLCLTPALPGSVFVLDDDPSLLVGSARLFPARVVSITAIAAGIYRLVIKTPPNMLLKFQGGQYANLRVQGVERSYSILSAHEDQVEFMIKMVPQGAFGRWLSTEAVAGAMLQMRAPFGRFILRHIEAKGTYFVSTGTGIVPILAMLRGAHPDQMSGLGRLKVLWGNKLRAEVFNLDELRRECQRLGAELELVYSREANEMPLRVTTRLAGENLCDTSIYAAGNPDMIRELHALWLARPGKGRFFSDAFFFAGSAEGGK